MGGRSITLNAFRLHDVLEGEKIGSFDDFLIEEHGCKRIFDLSTEYPFKARLYVSEKEEKEPTWSTYLRSGFKELPEFLNSVTNRALLIIAAKYRNRIIHFGLTFGFGRYLLKPSSYVKNYGLKVVLNAIYRGGGKKGEFDTNLIQSLDVKTVAANTFHTRRQADGKTNFEMFGVDVHRDILRSITGKPASEDDWGTRISGSDAVTFACSVDFRELGERCKLIETLYRKNDYEAYFSWIDNVKVISDPHLKEELELALLDSLKSKKLESIEMAPPEIIDWDRIKGFRFSFDASQVHKDLTLGAFLEILEAKNKLQGLTIKHLRSGYRIEALDNNEDPLWTWSSLQCIFGEILFKKRTYVLEDGEFYEVNDAYRKSVDEYINTIQEYGGNFPRCEADWQEDDFNENAATLAEYLLLHKEPVRLPGKTTPIEICDLLSNDQCFIHVKPKVKSSTLSHLFAQGYVSGELFCTNPEYREKALAAISKAIEAKTGKAPTRVALGKIAGFQKDSVDSRRYKVVFAIIDNWADKEFKDKLPFFSKINLRKSAQDLQALGFEVLTKRIQRY